MNGNAADGTTRAGSSCTPPRPEGAIVNVSLRNAGGSMMGGNTTMMGNDARRPSESGGHMQGNGQGMMSGNGNGMMPSGEMSLIIDRSSVHSGKVSFVATNDGSITHELVVLPLAESKAAGNSPMSTENKIDETDSLGEASATCAAGAGSGIASGTAGWVTLTLAPGRYEVVCNLPGHYVAGMYRELTVI
ncbi:hypothetical protein KIV56_09190 [Cryobacterium breve]|uniref:Sulfocyanin-like C-terminal domain-containing protein n=2 Tax=Cryobacterium breve TaxID=1259258 RepID=A0ABY7NG28_9MICO|nr:hypothetical protein KIV56_09190 [Cryobacterium breve]